MKHTHAISMSAFLNKILYSCLLANVYSNVLELTVRANSTQFYRTRAYNDELGPTINVAFLIVCSSASETFVNECSSDTFARGFPMSIYFFRSRNAQSSPLAQQLFIGSFNRPLYFCNKYVCDQLCQAQPEAARGFGQPCYDFQ